MKNISTGRGPRVLVVLTVGFGAFAGFTVASPPAQAAGTWNVQPSPSPAVAVLDTDLTGVTCTSATQCFAVGSAIDHPIIRRWNGTEWVNVPMTDPHLVNPPGVFMEATTTLATMTFESVACLTSTSCFAAGTRSTRLASPTVLHGEIARYNGSVWVSVANGTATLASPQLHSVSCTTTSCVAVGEARTSTAANAGTRTVAVRWNGSSWALQSTPNVAGATSSRLRSVKCTSSTNCVAVGFSTTGSTTRTLIERWNGTSWSITASPNPSGASTSALHAVACPATTSCFAVGSTKTGSTQTTLIERWNGSAWSILTSPTPPGSSAAKWSGVACAGTATCFAVGTTGTLPASARWNGTAWSLLSTPNVSGSTNTTLTAINCTSATSCYAVGRRAQSGNAPPFKRLIERWNGSTWSIVTEAVDGANSAHADVACSTATNCFAVGVRNDPTGAQSLIQRWQGGSWFAVTAPTPPGGGSHALAAITCPGPTTCIAVGRHHPAGAANGLAMRWNGNSWIVQTLPVDAQVDELRGIGCASTTSCFAVGTSGNASKILRWDGTTWTTSPSGTVNDADLASVSCATATMCMAVGLIRDFVVSGPNRTYALRWNGTTWTEAPDPGDAAIIGTADASDFLTIACPLATRCFAAGSQFIPFIGIGNVPYMRQWDGTQWTSAGSPPLSGRRFTDVGCANQNSCVAIGESYFTSGFEVTPGAVAWNGTSWSSTADPVRPTSAQQATLGGVACTSATVCVAAGSWTSTTGTRTLIERYA